MAYFMAVVTLTAYPLWYTVSSLVVFATRPPMTASLVALLGVHVQVNAPLHAWLSDDSMCSLNISMALVYRRPPSSCCPAASGGVLVVGANVACPPDYSNHSRAAVAVYCQGSGRGGKIQVPREVRGAEVPGAPAQGAPILIA